MEIYEIDQKTECKYNAINENCKILFDIFSDIASSIETIRYLTHLKDNLKEFQNNNANNLT